jgi:ferrous iron transport protein B
MKNQGSRMKKIVLVGNPNVGKSLIFSRITGIAVVSANYGGTTVEVKKGRFKYRDAEFELMDIPGVYSLEAFSKADETALRLIDEGDIIVAILDSTNLERNLTLTLQLIAKRTPMVVCLNFWDDTAHKGITIDAAALELLLDVPVVTTSALKGEGISTLVSCLERARPGAMTLNTADLWPRIGEIVTRVQKVTHRHHTPLERLSDFTLNPVGGLFSAFAVLITVFLVVRFLGETLVNAVCGPFYSRLYSPHIIGAVQLVPWDFLRGLLIGHTADPLQSFGVLTTGIYISLVLVFPYFFSFYLLFGILEDFGYLPRLAVVLDTFFHKIGLHGESSIPVMLGLGCKVPAFMATRVLSSRREKVLTMALILMSAPCLPQSAMIISLGMPYGVGIVITIFIILFTVALVMNMLLNKITRGERSELFIELPCYRMPSVKLLGKKLRMRIVDYLREVFPLITAGVLLINILDSLHVISFISSTAGKAVTTALGLPAEIAPVMILGFLRKDVSIALLAPFNLSAGQFVIASVFMVMYVPCIASLFTLIRELGVRSAFKVMGLVFVTAIAVTTLLHGLFVLSAPFSPIH